MFAEFKEAIVPMHLVEFGKPQGCGAKYFNLVVGGNVLDATAKASSACRIK